jgi:hypothetical protein
VRTGGFLRSQLARRLRSAYALGLITDDTFAHRIDALYGPSVIDPQRLVGDLTFRPRGGTRTLRRTLIDLVHVPGLRDRGSEQLPLLALDWTGATAQLLIGRSTQCDLMLQDRTVSRHHAQLFFREGRWILVDLDSTNGTFLNERAVRRSELLPGDTIQLGLERFRVD